VELQLGKESFSLRAGLRRNSSVTSIQAQLPPQQPDPSLSLRISPGGSTLMSLTFPSFHNSDKNLCRPGAWDLSLGSPALTSQRGRKNRAHAGSTCWATPNTVHLSFSGTYSINRFVEAIRETFMSSLRDSSLMSHIPQHLRAGLNNSAPPGPGFHYSADILEFLK
jgi:hypothetical protein